MKRRAFLGSTAAALSSAALASNGVLYEDINVVREFERFFIEAVAQAGRRQTEN